MRVGVALIEVEQVTLGILRAEAHRPVHMGESLRGSASEDGVDALRRVHSRQIGVQRERRFVGHSRIIEPLLSPPEFAPGKVSLRMARRGRDRRLRMVSAR